MFESNDDSGAPTCLSRPLRLRSAAGMAQMSWANGLAVQLSAESLARASALLASAGSSSALVTDSLSVALAGAPSQAILCVAEAVALHGSGSGQRNGRTNPRSACLNAAPRSLSAQAPD